MSATSAEPCGTDQDSLLLILGTNDDPHVERVSRKAQCLGLQAIVLDHNERCHLLIEQSVAGDVEITIDDDVHFDAQRDHLLVWNRQKLSTTIPFFFPNRSSGPEPRQDPLPERYLAFLATEWRATYRIFLSLFEKKTLNDPIATLRTASKIVQQNQAARCGLFVPLTMVSNNKDDVLDFVTRHDSVIKGLGTPRIEPDPQAEDGITANMMTMSVTTDVVQSATEEQFRLVPSFIQMNIRKDHELRVVYVDGRFFAFRIPSQTLKLTSTDWRYGNAILPFDPVHLTGDTENGLRSFMERCGLAFGSIDMIVDEEGCHWFLEVNQDGAWAWLDDRVDGEISDEFARAFMRRSEETQSVDPASKTQ